MNTSMGIAYSLAETLHFTRNKRQKILLVEDDSVYASMCESMLSRMNCDVTLAEKGHDAIRAAGDGRYDLCLVDLNLPDMSGVDVGSQLKLAYPNMEIVLYSGAVSNSTYMMDALDQGFTVLGKPLRPQNIRSFLRSPVTIN